MPDNTSKRDCSLAMVHHKVMKQLKLLKDKNYAHDPELLDDLEYLWVGRISIAYCNF